MRAAFEANDDNHVGGQWGNQVKKFETTVIDKAALSNNSRLIHLAYSAYEFLRPLEQEYPQFSKWYFDKVINTLYENKRTLLIVRHGYFTAGMAILKDEKEKKICTLRIHPGYQKRGIGTFLLHSSIKRLKTDKPLITVACAHVEQFRRLLNRFGFVLSDVRTKMYTPCRDEYIFNGTIER